MRHRQPSILDVVTAVRRIALSHPEVRGWWYAPALRLRLAGDRAGDGQRHLVEVAVEGGVDGGADCERITRELSRALNDVPVRVRAYRGPHEERQLFRLASGDGRAAGRA